MYVKHIKVLVGNLDFYDLLLLEGTEGNKKNMINHLENYDKLDTPNAKMLALRKQKEAIEEEMQKLISECVMCRCGFLMTKEKYDRDKKTYKDPCYGDLDWVECPVCRKRIFR